VRIQAETHPGNLASQRVLEKVGFKKEGLIRQSFFSRGVYRDTAMWSILRSEWKEPKILPIGYRRARRGPRTAEPRRSKRMAAGGHPPAPGCEFG
jgi:hypothetical protein